MLCWIEGVPTGRLAIGPRPLGRELLVNEIQAWKLAGVDVAASMLRPDEVQSYELTREAELCAALGINYLSFPISDHGVPESRRATLVFVQALAGFLKEDKSILIHCFAGIGRSALIASCVMGVMGVEIEDAFERIGQARGFNPIPETQEQRDWVYDFIDGLETGWGS